jgi:BirA family transcriptional regulator, biotin operon repressor / biotin---[acetyl-CoA-carboxylase] ligase
MNLVRDLSQENEGLTVVSLRQFAGRGRNDNEWLSQPGGLYFSFLLKPGFVPLWNEKLYVMTTKAVESVIRSYLPSQKIEFKIPNDVLVNGMKISGVLIDAKVEGNKNLFLIVGIGININNTVPPSATSIEREGVKGITPMEVLTKFQVHFEIAYNDWLASIKAFCT